MIIANTEMDHMPENCIVCDFSQEYGRLLCIVREELCGKYFRSRPSWCPLLEVKEDEFLSNKK